MKGPDELVFVFYVKTKKTGCGLVAGTVTAGGKRDSVKFSLGHIPHEYLYLYLCVCNCIFRFDENCLWSDWWQRRRGQKRLCILHFFTTSTQQFDAEKDTAWQSQQES